MAAYSQIEMVLPHSHLSQVKRILIMTTVSIKNPGKDSIIQVQRAHMEADY